MPREQITKPRTTSTDNPHVFIEEPRRHLHIGWNRAPGDDEQGIDGWVQFSTDVTVSELRSMLVSAEGDAEREWAKAQHMGNGVEHLAREDFIALQSYRVVGDVLDRDEVNRLVRHARRARNAAYGSDE